MIMVGGDKRVNDRADGSVCDQTDRYRSEGGSRRACPLGAYSLCDCNPHLQRPRPEDNLFAGSACHRNKHRVYSLSSGHHAFCVETDGFKSTLELGNMVDTLSWKVRLT